MTSVAEIQSASVAVVRAADDLVSHKVSEQQFLDAIEKQYQTVKAIKTGVDVGATADKLFRQSNLLNTSSKDLVAAVNGGGTVEPYLTRVKNGATNVQKTATQLWEESQA